MEYGVWSMEYGLDKQKYDIAATATATAIVIAALYTLYRGE